MLVTTLGYHNNLTTLGAPKTPPALHLATPPPSPRLVWVEHDCARSRVDSALVHTIRRLRMLEVKLADEPLHRAHHVEVRILVSLPHVAQGPARGHDSFPPVVFGRHARTGVLGILGDLARFPPVSFRGVVVDVVVLAVVF